MRVRGAGGLLVGVAVYPLAFTLDVYSQRGGSLDVEEAARDLLWWPDGASVPAHTIAFILLRDLLLFGSLAAGILGLAGVRASRFLIAIGAAGIALGTLPSIVYNPFDFAANPPPDWVFEDQLWYLSGRWAAVMWFTMCVAVVVMALTDSAAPATVPFGAPDAAPPPGPPLQPQPSHWTQPVPTTPSPTASPPTASSTTPEGPSSPISPPGS